MHIANIKLNLVHIEKYMNKKGDWCQKEHTLGSIDSEDLVQLIAILQDYNDNNCDPDEDTKALADRMDDLKYTFSEIC